MIVTPWVSATARTARAAFPPKLVPFVRHPPGAVAAASSPAPPGPAAPLARRESVPRARAVESAVHVAEPEPAADEQHPVDRPPVEVQERPGDRLPLQNRERLDHRLVGRHPAPRAVPPQGGSREGPGRDRDLRGGG